MDNYLNLYVPIRLQEQVNVTLRRTFAAKERSRLELYEKEITAELYTTLLEDEGHAGVAEAMRLVHERAVLEGEEMKIEHAREEAILNAARDARTKPIVRGPDGSNVIEDY